VLQVSEWKQEFAGERHLTENSGCHYEEFVDEPILTPDIIQGFC
jgi:hypothetical protein